MFCWSVSIYHFFRGNDVAIQSAYAGSGIIRAHNDLTLKNPVLQEKSNMAAKLHAFVLLY